MVRRVFATAGNEAGVPPFSRVGERRRLLAIGADHSSPLTPQERANFEALYQLHHGEVVQILRRRLDNAADVEDLTHEAYLRVLRYRHCGSDSLKYLLIRTALNLAASHGLRACISRTHVPLDTVEIESDALSLEDEVADAQCRQQLVTAMQMLPHRCREIFSLRLLHGLLQHEIAERCGISTRRVEQHLAKAQLLIRQRVGGASASAAPSA